MDLTKARRIVRLVEQMHVTWDELRDLFPIPAGTTPYWFYHEAWTVCFKADIDEFLASMKE